MEKKYYTAVNEPAQRCIKRMYVPRGKTGKILKHMQAGRPISSMGAFKLYNETRLSAVIFNLKKYGYNIGDKWEESPMGEKYKLYYLEEE